MSHFHQRKEKNCLNCNAEVLGHYCQICGQENVEPKQTTGHLVSHFFNDVTHFDGKFFSTIGTLIRRPGFLTVEYVRGRRMEYLDPIRMYIFTSAIFFLLFFGVFHIQEQFANLNVNRNSNAYQADVLMGLNDKKLHTYTLKKYGDSTMTREEALERVAQNNQEDSTQKIQRAAKARREVMTYDSAQQALPKEKRDGWLHHRFKRKVLQINEASQKDGSKFLSLLFENFLHKLPQLLFVSLPLFALLLKVLYWRRKEFYYTSHVIFAVHLYIFSFINLLVQLFIDQLEEWSGWAVFGWISLALFLWIFLYQYKAMRRFYAQSRLKTIAKFLLINLFAAIVLSILSLLFFMFSAASIV